jgi:hypothetical protein
VRRLRVQICRQVTDPGYAFKITGYGSGLLFKIAFKVTGYCLKLRLKLRVTVLMDLGDRLKLHLKLRVTVLTDLRYCLKMRFKVTGCNSHF